MADDDYLSEIPEGGILYGLVPRGWTPEGSGLNVVMGPQNFTGLTPYQSQQEVKLGGIAVSPVLPAGIMALTTDQLRAIMPHARSSDIEAARMPLAIAMADHGITLPAQQAAFLGQIAAEGGISGTSENLNYNVDQLMQYFPRRFSARADALPFAHAPQRAANFLYSGRNGNIPDTDDGWTYRGRGPMQVTGRANYRALGFEDDPDALNTPYGGMQGAAGWWENNRLPEQTASELDRPRFERVTDIVNRGIGNSSRDRRWESYQRALAALGR